MISFSILRANFDRISYSLSPKVADKLHNIIFYHDIFVDCVFKTYKY